MGSASLAAWLDCEESTLCLKNGENSFMKSFLGRVKAKLPQSWVGFAEYNLRPKVLDGYGVLNGQVFRQLIFVDLNRVCEFEAIVETGTFVGCTTQFFAENTEVPVFTVESNARAFQLARRRLKSFPNVHSVRGDSVEFLRALPLAPATRAFFYLDAHWEDRLPLAEEVESIASRFSRFVIMIDDFEVPGDAGYGFDDYGPGKQLSLRDFPFHQDSRLCVYFPRRHSSQESGSRRGCAFLVSREMRLAADSLDCLTPGNLTASIPVA